MGRPRKDYGIKPGDRIYSLTVLEVNLTIQATNGPVQGICVQCDCGAVVEKVIHNLVRNKEKRCSKQCPLLCGEELGNWKGGYARHNNRAGWFKSYCSMVARCTIPSASHYAEYGGRGVTVCEEWLHDPLNFYAVMGERPNAMTLDRISPFGNYGPDNCRWAPKEIQANNKRHQLGKE